jgi:4-hydroxybenzoate polyprenyltransferase
MGLPKAGLLPYLPPMAEEVEQIIPDSELRGIVARLPAAIRPFWLLGRFDRPIGSWLLFWPGAWAIALADKAFERWDLILWFAFGSVVMRGAGCVYNDIVDRDLDRKVARTAARPLASGRVSLKAAWLWLVLLCLLGLIVLLQLNFVAAITALASLGAVAAYPFMKRITWWPQAWLGIVFSWAALVGWPAVTGGFAPALWLLYAGSIFWVVGYDTIYALQDIEDDALAGVKSSARALGGRARLGIGVCYGVALCLWCAAFWQVRPQLLGLAALLPLALHFGWQLSGLDRHDPADALRRFRSNRFAGLLMFLACLVVGATA